MLYVSPVEDVSLSHQSCFLVLRFCFMKQNLTKAKFGPLRKARSHFNGACNGSGLIGTLRRTFLHWTGQLSSLCVTAVILSSGLLQCTCCRSREAHGIPHKLTPEEAQDLIYAAGKWVINEVFSDFASCLVSSHYYFWLR